MSDMLFTRIARRFAIPRKGSIWCLAPLVDGSCMFIPEKEAAFRPIWAIGEFVIMHVG